MSPEEDVGGMESFLDVDVSDATEPVAAPAGEHKIRISGGVIDKDKNGHPYFQPRFDVPDMPEVKDFTDFIGLPYDGMDEKRAKRSKWRLRCFKECFGIDPSAKVNLRDDLPGLTGWAILGLGEDPQYGEQNFIRKYIAPK